VAVMCCSTLLCTCWRKWQVPLSLLARLAEDGPGAGRADLCMLILLMLVGQGILQISHYGGV
jgi:hypothetical protein